MPWWSVLADEAKLLGMALPVYLRWLQRAEGQWWIERLRLKWRVEAAWREQEGERQRDAAEDAHWRAQGWRGGTTEPQGEAREG